MWLKCSQKPQQTKGDATGTSHRSLLIKALILFIQHECLKKFVQVFLVTYLAFHFMQAQVTIATFEHGTEVYQHMLQLRITVLLEPIGIDASFIKPQQEKDDMLIGAFADGKLIGCCVLTPRNNEAIQLRQMAVATALQGQGIGAAIVQFAEQVAKAKHFQTLLLHARSKVVPFYLKNGYAIVGDKFEEVGIPHYSMEKIL